MVSKKAFRKFVPSKLKIPKAKCEVSFTQDLSKRKQNKLERVAQEGIVIYDTRKGKFFLEYGDEIFPIEIRATDNVPEYMFNRIKVEVPKGLFNKESPYWNTDFFYLNPFSRSWITPQRQAVPSAYEGRLWGYLSDLLKTEIVDFNSEEGRKLKEKNRGRLSRYVTNAIANRI